jgi:hypothetical protein
MINTGRWVRGPHVLDLLDRALVKLREFPEDLALVRQPDLQGLGRSS